MNNIYSKYLSILFMHKKKRIQFCFLYPQSLVSISPSVPQEVPVYLS